MLKLCGITASNYYNKVKLQLVEKGVPFEEEVVPPSQKDDVVARTAMGKVPFVEVNGHTLTESQVIAEYIEEAYPAHPLLPRDPLARAKARELIEFVELHVEQVARRLYGEAFFGASASDSAKQAVERDLAKGVTALMRLAKFAPFAAGPEFSLADCAAIVHLPVVTLATKKIYGRDFFAGHPEVGAYLKEMGERPAVRRVVEERKAQQRRTRVTERTIAAFFYGLYMDEGVLRDKGVEPRHPRKAVVPGYRTRIGARATLVPRFGSQAFGMVFDVTHAELQRLYSGAGLDLYRAESVLAFFTDGSCAPVATFNLAEPPAPGEGNAAYAAKLRGVLERLGLPADDLE